MTTAGYISLVAAVAGIIGALVAAFKLQPERNSIMVTTAEGLVVMQSKVLERVNAELEDCERDRQELRAMVRKLQDAAREHGWRID